MFIPRYPVHLDIAIEGGEPIWNRKALDLHSQGAWLNNALVLEAYNSSAPNLRALTNRLFEEVQAVITKQFKSPPRAKEALKTVLINLWDANLMGMPVRYSRTMQDYTKDSRYGQWFFRYDTLIPVIDALIEQGYIEGKEGRSRYEDKSKGYYARMWASPKLIGLFIEHMLIVPGFYNKPIPTELIVLNKEVIEIDDKGKEKKRKIKVAYPETKQTLQMRKDLQRYNSFVEQNKIEIALPGNEVVTYHFLFNLYKAILNHKVIINEVIYNKDITNKLHIDYIKSNLNKYYIKQFNNIINPEIQIPTPISTITRMDCCKDTTDKDLHKLRCFDWVWNFIWFLSQKYRDMAIERRKYDDVLYEEFRLDDINIDYLKFELRNEVLHRVFNKNSFRKGGRAYGAFYQRIPENIRRHILINGDQTTEPDFSAYHIRMLYHNIGIDYRNDPYIECGGKEYREAFKCASLVAINAKNEAEGMNAIREELEENGIPLPNHKKPLKWMISRFREAHHPIADFICSNKGVDLQNKDSHIMNAILMRLMDNGILGLPIHDSVIVAKQHEKIAKEIMTREYENVMDFKPVF